MKIARGFCLNNFYFFSNQSSDSNTDSNQSDAQLAALTQQLITLQTERESLIATVQVKKLCCHISEYVKFNAPIPFVTLDPMKPIHNKSSRCT